VASAGAATDSKKATTVVRINVIRRLSGDE